MSPAVTLEFEGRPSAPAYMLRAVLPASRPHGVAPDITARWSGHRVDRDALAKFLRIAELPAGPSLPLLYPHVFGFRLPMAVLTHPAFPVPIWGVLQTRNHLLQHRPIARDASLDFETRVHTGRVLEKGAEIDLHTTVHVDGALAWESVLTFYTRGRFGEPGPASPLAASPPHPAPIVAEWTMRDDAHWTFGSFTGDYNGIHAWDWYARRLGFQRALYHPGRVLAQCLAHLPALDPDSPQRLDAWIKGPVPHGTTVQLHARTEDAGTTFALHVEPARPAFVGRLREVAPGARLLDDHGRPVSA